MFVLRNLSIIYHEARPKFVLHYMTVCHVVDFFLFLGKQVVISSTRKNEDYSEDKEDVPEYYEWLNVYNVNDNGTVELVTNSVSRMSTQSTIIQ